MINNKMKTSIEDALLRQVQKDSKIKSAYLLVESEKLGLHLNTAAGVSDDMPARPEQANYMASVGKIFTSTLTGILSDQGKLSFEEPIIKYLDEELVNKLHVYKGTDYTPEIKIKHLLNHTSGLYDYFWPLLDKLIDDPSLELTPQKSIIWGKNNLQPYFSPGNGFHYTDTNYHLLGLIIEKVTKLPFHEALMHFIFKPNDMKHSFMLHYSEPMAASRYPVSSFYYRGHRLNDLKSYAGLDYAGGGIVAPNEDLLKFMKGLSGGRIIKKETLELMRDDKAKYGTGIDYGYGIMQFKPVFLLMPKTFKSWGHPGATGSFMFYHPEKDAYIIGTFNDFSYEKKGVRFMLMKVINTLYKLQKKTEEALT